MSNQTDANLAEARRWLKQADEHLAVARWDGHGEFWAPACFQAQQAAELALRAVLIREGERSVVTHGVVALVERVTKNHASFASLAAGARRLDLYHIPTRYPNSLASGTAAENFDREDFQTAIDAATKVIEAARRIVKQA